MFTEMIIKIQVPGQIFEIQAVILRIIRYGKIVIFQYFSH